jgi:predicted transcriptional regulator
VVDDATQEPEGSASNRILEYVRGNPGCHLRQIKKELDLAMGTVQYQLERLEKSGRITSTRRGFYRYYFPVGMLDNERDILEVLSQETAREILLFIIENGDPTHTEISEKTKISSPSVNWHIRRLKDLGLIREEKEGKYKRYRLNGDSKPIVALLKSYYPSVWDKWSNRLAEMFLSLSRGEQQGS